MGLASILEPVLFPPVLENRAALSRALAGKTVLITGASYGIGEQAARIAADAGARVLLAARTAERLQAVAAEIGAAGGQAATLPCDLADPASVQALIEALADHPPPDVFVSNAGKSIRRPLFESLDRLHDVTRTAGVNYLGPIQLALALIPGLVQRRGQIVSVSAANVLLPPAPRWAAYQASKSAFDQWLRSAAPELRSRGVAVSTLYLPLVRTRMIAPTRLYDRAPAMSPRQAALRVVGAILTRRRRWTPWWFGPAGVAAAALRGPWELLAERRERGGP